TDGRVANASGTILRDPSAKAATPATLEVRVPTAKPTHNVAQNMGLIIAYEDEHLIVVDKPAGMVVHPAAGNFDGTMVNALLHHCAGQLSGIGGVARPGIVHRIDKDTSGLIVAAKHDRAHEGLAKQFAAHSADHSSPPQAGRRTKRPSRGRALCQPSPGLRAFVPRHDSPDRFVGSADHSSLRERGEGRPRRLRLARRNNLLKKKRISTWWHRRARTCC
ncbi:MAG: hypothetical protein K0M55_17735, partial [Rhizobium sp.]|nr:hypothetical protein [Rhizobium sp.]